MNKMTVMMAVALMAAGVTARTHEVSAWKGETLAFEFETAVEKTEIGFQPKLEGLPAGFVGQIGLARPVKFERQPHSGEFITARDRVEWNAKETALAAGCPRLVVVEVKVPASAKPGTVTFKASGDEVKLTVVDRVLPPAKEWKYFLDLWQHPWAVSRYHDVKPFSKKHYAKMRPVYELLASAGQKTITTTILPEAWDHQCYDAYGTMIGRVKREDGTWQFDYSVFDEYVEFCRGCGLGPAICCYTLCPWGYVVRWQNAKGETESCVAKPGTKEFEDYWGVFLQAFATHLKQKGWFEQTYISMDERSIEDVKLIGEFVQKHAPGLRISMAGNQLPSQYGVTIDDFCMILSDKINADYLKEAAERRAKGMVTTYYVCCWPLYPNTFMSSGPGEAFWLGAYPAMIGLDGFLRWAWNSWPKDPKEDATYWAWTAGDTFLCYPDGEPSWRFMELRNGIAAAEKVRLLKEQGLFKEELAKVAALYKQDEATANKSNFVKIRQATLDAVNK